MAIQDFYFIADNREYFIRAVDTKRLMGDVTPRTAIHTLSYFELKLSH
jgi:hypothetical protein